MSNLSSEIMEQMNTATVFTVFGIEVDEGVVVSWIVMAVLILFSFLMTRKLRVHDISKRQAAIEFIVVKLESFVGGMIGDKGKRYVPFLITVLLYIGLSNIIGVFGFKPPTKDLNVTIALAVMSIILVQIAAVKEHGAKGWLKGFTKPVVLVTPFNILDLITRPLSLCMRLFGNVVGAFIIMELLKCLVPVVVPSVFSIYFDFFDGLLQAYVFVFLTSIYIKEAIED
jgi:F-type H+-transporting ATPase subunit a